MMTKGWRNESERHSLSAKGIRTGRKSTKKFVSSGFEYVIWGTKDGVEDIVRINGMEVQNDLEKVNSIIDVLKERGEFEKLRVQTLDLKNYDVKKEFRMTLGGK